TSPAVCACRPGTAPGRPSRGQVRTPPLLSGGFARRDVILCHMARPTGRSAPTLESVAERAGVSRATAGRVLAGATTVGEQAREARLGGGPGRSNTCARRPASFPT